MKFIPSASAPSADAPQSRARVTATEIEAFVAEGRGFLARRAELSAQLAARIGSPFVLAEEHLRDFARARAGVDLAATLEPKLLDEIAKFRSRGQARSATTRNIIQDRQAAVERAIAASVRAALPAAMFEGATVDVSTAKPLVTERAARLDTASNAGEWPMPPDTPIEKRLDRLEEIAAWLRTMATELDRLDEVGSRYSERAAA